MQVLVLAVLRAFMMEGMDKEARRAITEITSMISTSVNPIFFITASFHST
jgi:hypothetical protein